MLRSMSEIAYFAYGSNMLTQRIAARCPNVRPIGPARLAAHDVRFVKRSLDGSAKAGLVEDNEAAAYGVLFSVKTCDLEALDVIEGPGYARSETLEVQLLDRSGAGSEGSPERGLVPATTYLPLWVEKGMRPYDWYLGLMVAGAREHGLPTRYVEALSQVTADPDLDIGRGTAVQARRILAAYEMP